MKQFSRFLGFYRYFGTATTKVNEPVYNKTIQICKEKQTHGKERIYSKPKGPIVSKTKRRKIGKKIDYKIYKKNYPKLSNEVSSMFDLGFIGVKKDFPGQNHYQKKERV